MIKTLDERGEREADQQKLRVFFSVFGINTYYNYRQRGGKKMK